MTDLSQLPSFEEGYVPVVGGRIHYASAGDGPMPIVCLHKLGGWVAEWRWIMPILATRTRVIAMDLPGHGGSKMEGDPPFICTQEEAAAKIMAAADSLGVSNFSFVGSSEGGCVATVCAAMWPEKVSSVASLGSALAGSAPRAELRKATAQAIADGYFDENENPIPRNRAYMERVFGMRNPSHMDEQNLSREAAGRWIQPNQRGVGLYDYLAKLPRIEQPFLLAYGTRGGYGRYVEEANSRLKNSRIVPIEASAFPHQDQPEETVTLVMDFLDV